MPTVLYTAMRRRTIGARSIVVSYFDRQADRLEAGLYHQCRPQKVQTKREFREQDFVERRPKDLFDELALKGITGQFGVILEIHLFQNPRAVGAHRRYA